MSKAIGCTFIACFIVMITLMDLMWGKPLDSLSMKRTGHTKPKKVKKAFNYEEIEKDFYVKNAVIGVGGFFVIALIFIRSIGLACVASMGGLFYPFIKHKKDIDKRKKMMDIQLREAMYSISNSLKAGNSLQRAIENCTEDLKITLMAYKEKPILEEMELIVYEQQLGRSLDEALISFKNRVQMEDVDTFVTAAIITREKGGNLTEVMSNVSASISDKLEIKRDILILTASKRSEAKLLSFVPAVFVVALSLLAPSYMAPMYETALGKVLMLIGITLLVINYILGQKIIDIDV